MRLLFTALACLLSVSLSAQEQVITYPYNPDADTDSLIAVPDMLDLLVLFGSEFIPEPVTVDGIVITEWLENNSNSSGGGGCDFLYPEKHNMTPFLHSFIDNGSYIVPEGKILYVTHEYAWSGEVTGFSGNFAPNEHMPGMYSEGMELFDNNDDAAIGGFLASNTSTLTPFLHSFIDNGSYIVPDGKILYVTHEYAWSGEVTGFSGNLAPNDYMPGMYSEGMELFDNNDDAAIGGYLVDEDYFADCGGGGGSSEGADLPNGTSVGEMLYWNGNSWNSIDSGVEGSFLTMGQNNIPVWTTPSLSIGSNYGGGIIGYIFSQSDPGYVPGEIHGYVYRPDYQEMEWGCMGTVTGAHEGGLGQGVYNTALISSICPETNCAAKYCNSLVADGYDDWFLPTYAEANKAYQHLYTTDGGQISIWLSQEALDDECGSYCTDENVAKHLFMLNGLDYHEKHSEYRVYPVRAF